MRGLARIYGVISLVSFTLAIALMLTSGPQPQAGTLVRAFGAPKPRPAPAACPGVVLSGGHSGCLQFTQVTCRPARTAAVFGGQPNPEDLITATGQLPGANQTTLTVTPTQTRVALVLFGATTILYGAAPASFDILQGAQVDADVGPPGSPDLTHVKGYISCGA